MFKLESYITPVLLNYVGKYVKNFRAEQSQVSLWGGDATFQNLDLRLGVLNEQFDLPFTFISGHIHELLIHVPWVKIISEPIVITINTIECILKMKDGIQMEEDANIQYKTTVDSLQEDTPSSYIKSIVTKVVNNITINCNNLILKFVEEDIVLSVNIRFLSMQTVNDEWKPTFIDVNITDMILRKVMIIEDLTLCLDRMDASGKIDIYQDPVVYRCSMTIRWIINYQTNIMKRISMTRFDLHCQLIEFSMTEQQIPMLLRLITILMESSHGQRNKSASRKLSTSSDDIENEDDDNSNSVMAPIGNNNQAWVSWAWNTLTSIVPVDWNNDTIDKQTNRMTQTLNFGIYIDYATLTFKTVENSKGETFGHKNLKVRYRPFLTLNLSNVIGSIIIEGMAFNAIRIGFSYVCLIPRGNCSCGYSEVKSNVDPKPYICAGKSKTTHDYLSNSLFDPNSDENNGKIDSYDKYIAHCNINNLLKKSSALVIEYVHNIELPEGITEEQLLAYGGNFEFSNFHEHDLMRYVIGDLSIRICSGFLHRVSSIVHGIKNDLASCIVEKCELSVDELPLVTVEEYEALNDYIPIAKTMLNIIKLSIHIQIADHYRDKRKFNIDEVKNLKANMLNYPVLIVEMDKVNFQMLMPLYAFRLAACASKQEKLPNKMLENCYQIMKIEFLGFTSRLNLTQSSHMLLIMPCSTNLSTMTLLYPQYWNDSHIKRVHHEFKMDSLTLTSTKPKLMIVYTILCSNFVSTTKNIVNQLVSSSSLYHDACNEKNSIYLELSFESIIYTNSVASKMISKKMSIGSLRIFAFNDINQAIVFSGPEYSLENSDRKLINIQLHYPYDSSDLMSNTSIAKFRIAQSSASIDPLFLDWLSYQCTYYDCNPIDTSSGHHGNEETSSDTSTRKKFPSLDETVHSPSDKDRKFNALIWMRPSENQFNNCQSNKLSKNDGILKTFISWRPWWKQLTLSGNIEPVVIYMPTLTMDGIGVDGIEESKNHAFNKNDLLKIFAIKTSDIVIRSTSWNDQLSVEINKENFLRSSTKLWSNKSSHFPWLVNLTDFRCYTIEKFETRNFFIMESLNATIDATIKPHANTIVNTENSSSTFGFCTYINTSPIIISICKEQLGLIEMLYVNVSRVVDGLIESCNKDSIIVGNEPDCYSTLQDHTPFSPTQILCTDTDTTSTASTSRHEQDLEVDGNVAITSWIQWTITKIAIKLFTNDNSMNKMEYKLVMELEDIITSIDWQSIYLQIKNKITTATIYHYKRLPDDENWKLGDCTGLIMSSRDEIDWFDTKKITESDFLNVTITRAKSNNVYTKWRGVKQQKIHEEYLFIENNSMAMTNYITEIVIQMQMLDILLPIHILQQYSQFYNFYSQVYDQKSDKYSTRNTLPLVYLDFKGLTLILPVNSMENHVHNCLILETSDITILPHAKNPICRAILRTDIYELAAQANILNTPGSAVEDRQYQYNINSVVLYTTTLKNYEVSITKRKTQSLYTMNENPALEWNKLESDGATHQSSSCIIPQFNLCCIIAPPIIFKSNVIVCGSAVELTFLSDIKVMMNLEQIELLSILYDQFQHSDFNVRMKKLQQSDTQNENQLSYNATIKQCNVPCIKSLQESARDSGVDIDMSSIDIGLRALPSNNKICISSFEYLINGGAISILIYEATAIDECYPLICVTFNQFNNYISQLNSMKTLRINCFDVKFAIGDERCKISSLLQTSDFTEYIMETKNGDPHPNTGIPPSFLEFKWENYGGKSKIFIEMGRPTKINLSLATIDRLNNINDKITKCFISNCMKNTNASTINDWIIKDKKINIPEVNLKTKQIVLVFKSDRGTEITGSFVEFDANLSSKLRKLHGNISLTSMMITTTMSSVIDNNNIKALLNPFSCNFVINIVWESWQNFNETPLIRIQAFSDGIHFNIDPNQIKLLQDTFNDFYKLKEKYFHDENEKLNDKSSSQSTEQYYQDDLKAGAFHFADGTPDQLPLPYQVVFSEFPRQIMSWRYPQPRVLTQLSITKVLYEIIDDIDVDLDKIICIIEYWNESLIEYQRFIEFNLTEIDNTTRLPNKFPNRAVACLWRAIITHSDNETVSEVSARDLAGCIRIDSYFNSSLIPILEITANVEIIQLSLFNKINMNVYKKHLPLPLNKFQLNECLPTNINFACFYMKNLIMIFDSWYNSSTLFDLTANFGIQILDHGTMYMQELLEQLEMNIQITMAKQINCLIMCKDLWIKFGPEVSHTITISLDLWQAALGNCNNNIILLTGIVVANDLNIPIRFGQFDSTDGFLLPSRMCHFYSWRHQRNREMIIGYERMGVWTWSRPFTIENSNNAKPLKFHSDTSNYVDYERIYVTVKTLSSTQKMITFSGRLIISNQLNDHFELKLVKFNVVSDDIVIVLGHSQPPSLFVDEYGNNMAIRLRFANLPNCSWTGDVPLHANVKCDQPWLVKVPTHEKGQFLSIWVRIIQENSNEHCRTLVLLSPLYLIQSWLPISTEIKVETPTLNTSFIMKINGGCEREQMYCPGTFEHFHQIAFQPQSKITSTMSWIPLSYNSIDQRTFFKRPDKEDMEAILERLNMRNSVSTYPFLDDDMTSWIPVVDIPTNVQIKYRDAGLESSTLLLEIRPWCFILNSLGKSINLITPNGNLLCKIPHKGLASPQKMEGIFHIEIETVDGKKFKSSPLQLAHSEWNRGFIMPQINGLIPMDGTVKTLIDCDGDNSVILIINSMIYEDMRILKIMSSHIICNFTKNNFKVAPIIVDNQLSNVEIPMGLLTRDECLKLTSCNSQNLGIPIVQWYRLNNYDPRNLASLFICLCYEGKRSENREENWSCPVKVDQSIGRNCISICNGSITIPIVVTIQKDHELTYIAILDDDNPQMAIENTCPFTIIVGQANATCDDVEPDAPPFSWRCEIECGQLCHYTIKSFGNRIPDASIGNEITSSLIIKSLMSVENGGWKKVIELPSEPTIKFDQFVNTNSCGDIKIIVENRGHIIFIHLEPKSQLEVAVCDIRSRLMLEGTKLITHNDQKFHKFEYNESIMKNLTLSTSEDVSNINNDIATSSKTNEQKCLDKFLTVYFHGINLIITQDINERNNDRRAEVAGIYLTNTIIHTILTSKTLDIRIFIGDLQLDNQMFDNGGFDFPVVLISQKPLINSEKSIGWSLSLENTIAEIKKNSLISLELSWDIVENKKSCRDVHIKFAPINIYIEDRFVTQLLEYLTAMLRPCILLSCDNIESKRNHEITMTMATNTFVNIPPNIIIDARIMSSPLRLQHLIIEPISILLSVHTSVRLYVALDHSPLHFGIFDRNNLFTTPYRLGNALTMHYLSGAIFGAGWVVGSLEILGSPGSFAQALGVGLKDFIAMPFQGLLQGPWGFIVGITHGSASLMKNITAGTVNSVTKLASSVARNLDRLTLDEEHLQRQEESRRVRPQGMAQGLFQGLSGFGISILAAVGGLAHHPLQHVWSGEATTRGLVTGVGLGLVGVVTKPLSGAAELVALTGQGLLHRTGWNSLPKSRRLPNTISSCKFINTSNRYTYKLMSYLIKQRDCIIYLINGDYVIDDKIIPITIILTRYNLLIINADEDKMERVFSLKELNCWDDYNDSKSMKFIYVTSNKEREQHNVDIIEQPEMNQELRTRIEQYVLGSSTTTAGLTANISIDSDHAQSIESIANNNSIEKPMAFLIETYKRNNLMAIMKIIKRQNQGIDFTVL